MNTIDAKPNVSSEISIRTITILLYSLMALSFFLGITGIAAIIINYVKFSASIDTIYQSHFTWLRRTFWFGLLWTFLGIITCTIFVGFFILIANSIWIIYRLIKGFLLVLENKAISF